MIQSPFAFSLEESGNGGTLRAAVTATGEIVDVDKALAAAAAFDDVVPVGMLDSVRQAAIAAVDTARKAAEARFDELSAMVTGEVSPAKTRPARSRKSPARPKTEAAEQAKAETIEPAAEPAPMTAVAAEPIAVADIVEPAGDEVPPLAEAPDEAPDFDHVANFEDEIAASAPWAVAPTGIGPDDEF